MLVKVSRGDAIARILAGREVFRESIGFELRGGTQGRMLVEWSFVPPAWPDGGSFGAGNRVIDIRDVRCLIVGHGAARRAYVG